MWKILAIALNTYREAIRNRILYLFLFFALALIILSGVASTLAIGEREKIMRDLGLSGISFFGLLIALFVGIGLIYNDIERKTLYTIVSKPIDRRHFILGKFFGLLLTIYTVTLLMTLFFFATLHFTHYTTTEYILNELGGTASRAELLQHYAASLYYAVRDACVSFVAPFLPYDSLSISPERAQYLLEVWQRTEGLITALLLTWLEYAVIVAFAVLFSCFTAPFLAFFFTVVIFVIGRLNLDIMRFVDYLTRKTSYEELTVAGKALYYFAHFAAIIAPNLTYYNVRYQLIYEGALPGVDFMLHGLIYGVAYTGLILCLTIFIFNRRNFK